MWFKTFLFNKSQDFSIFHYRYTIIVSTLLCNQKLQEEF
jgi:hypothetical protein